MRCLPRSLGKWVLLTCGLLVAAGCAGPSNRDAIFAQLNPEPMSQAAWSRVTGTYSGPVHASAERYGAEGLGVRVLRVDLSGTADAPEAFIEEEYDYSTAWTPFAERKNTFTNIPMRRYGTQGTVYADTHAPDQLLLKIRRNGYSASNGYWMILTFHGDGVADVDFIGHSGWRGQGEFRRSPALARH